LDFAKAGDVFSGVEITIPDTRIDYGENRFITFGFLDARMVAVVWTHRGDARRVISMRYANEREIEKITRRTD
jgi:uncharacterized DUF497 family protein